MMSKGDMYWQKILIGLAMAILLVVGLGIIVYVGIARDRIMPTPTPSSTPTPSPSSSATPSPSATPSLSRISGTVREYSPGALIIVITPKEGDVEQIIVPENLEVTWDTGERASPREIAPGQEIEAEGELDRLGRLVARRIVIGVGQETPTPTHTLRPSTTPTPSLPEQAWEGEYHDNPTLSGIRYYPARMRPWISIGEMVPPIAGSRPITFPPTGADAGRSRRVTTAFTRMWTMACGCGSMGNF